ncbi:energy-coupling factor ABC transporter ATP-binding protein [Pontibaca methylaminivorans]|uniref:Biotin transport system ATP-binding protein n=1 Tax=Pontibaca methylaminivorans TaxID=515897 RepID=A0A1R3WIW3_9RHOB|nr:ABC transporter ATP-binding protein [Pontibaca methylaminivorans]SIT77858.1 biotin transport system ATP-binding protein [Pontibaca methylaminivorans]
MIELQGVGVTRGEREILSGIDLALAERRIGIIGRNGSGKSTLARLLNGLEAPTRGRVTLDGKAGGKALRRQVGFVFQNPDNQIVYPIVHEDLAFGLKGLRLGAEEVRARIDAVLDRFGISHLRNRLTHELSGGEKQMIALAGVMVMDPRVIVLDEPTTLLDLCNKRRFMEAIRALDQQVVMVSHDLDLLADFDRVLLIAEGGIRADGPPAAVIAEYVAGAKC